MFTHTRRLPMTLPKNKELNQNEIDSIKVAVEQYDIRAIHPDKMEDFAEYLVRKVRQSE
jgi:hypothetical protein